MALFLIKDGSFIFIGTEATKIQIVNSLDGKASLTMATNSLYHGLELSRAQKVKILMTGG